MIMINKPLDIALYLYAVNNSILGTAYVPKRVVYTLLLRHFNTLINHFTQLVNTFNALVINCNIFSRHFIALVITINISSIDFASIVYTYTVNGIAYLRKVFTFKRMSMDLFFSFIEFNLKVFTNSVEVITYFSKSDNYFPEIMLYRIMSEHYSAYCIINKTT